MIFQQGYDTWFKINNPNECEMCVCVLTCRSLYGHSHDKRVTLLRNWFPDTSLVH